MLKLNSQCSEKVFFTGLLCEEYEVRILHEKFTRVLPFYFLVHVASLLQ
jgi:hypothetical protein